MLLPLAQILSEDYSKAVFLCADRTLCFHARFGSYHKTRVPRCDEPTTACVCGVACEAYALHQLHSMWSWNGRVAWAGLGGTWRTAPSRPSCSWWAARPRCGASAWRRGAS